MHDSKDVREDSINSSAEGEEGGGYLAVVFRIRSVLLLSIYASHTKSLKHAIGESNICGARLQILCLLYSNMYNIRKN